MTSEFTQNTVLSHPFPSFSSQCLSRLLPACEKIGDDLTLQMTAFRNQEFYGISELTDRTDLALLVGEVSNEQSIAHLTFSKLQETQETDSSPDCGRQSLASPYESRRATLSRMSRPGNSGRRGTSDELRANQVQTAEIAALPEASSASAPAFLRVEAEDMRLSKYRREPKRFASGNALIHLKGKASQETGKATFEFAGASGHYDIVIAYHDEADGRAHLKVSLNGDALDNWQLDQNFGVKSPQSKNLVHRTVTSGLLLEQGDLLEVLGTESGGEYARIDYVDLIPVSAEKSVPIGTNLAGIADWSTQLPFIDAFRSARSWIAQKAPSPGQWWTGVWDTGEHHLLDLDEQGWVRSLPAPKDSPQYTHVGTLMFRDIEGHYPSGRYVVLYDGEGTLEYDFDARLVSSNPGRDIIEVTPSQGGVYVKLTDTHPDNYLRNIRVIPEAFEASYRNKRFNPDFIETIQPFPALRFMDWMATNNSRQQDWSDRPKLGDATWTEKGAPVEIMVELVNQTDAAPWFTLPHQATDKYVRNFATYVRDHLDPSKPVYVEYSNEVWNLMFEQGSWIEAQGKQQWSTSHEGDYTKRLDWFSQRTTQIVQIWEEVFGPQQERIIGVMGAQSANLWTAQRTVDYAWSNKIDLSHAKAGIDAVAIAPYFGNYLGDPIHETEVESWTKETDGGLNKLFDELIQGGVLSGGPAEGALAQVYDWVEDYADFAQAEGLQLLAYEGGQHLVGFNGVENNDAITNLFIEANRDPRLGDIYREYLETWFELGGGLFMNFSDITSSSKWGSWGTLEYLGQESSPKYNALLDLLDSATLSSASLG